MKNLIPVVIALTSSNLIAGEVLLPDNAGALPKISEVQLQAQVSELIATQSLEVDGVQYATLMDKNSVLQKGTKLYSTSGFNAFEVSGDLILRVTSGFDTSHGLLTEQLRLKSVLGDTMIFSATDKDTDLVALQEELIALPGINSVVIDVQALDNKPF